MSSRSGTLLIALSSLFMALMAVLTKTLAGRVPSSQLVAVRHLIGLCAMGGLFLIRARPPTLTRPTLLLMRGLFGGAGVLAYFFAIQALGAAPATVLNYIAPVYAAVWAALFLNERPSKHLIAGLLLATLGAVLVTLGSGDFSRFDASALGALAGILSGLSGGAAMATVKAAREDAGAPTIFLAFSVVGLALALPFAVPVWVPLHGETLALTVLIGLLGICGQILFTWGMGYTTATAGSATTQLVPVFAWALALGWLNEKVTATAVVGAVCCVGGVLVGMAPARLRR